MRIAADNSDIELLIWQAYLGLEAYMELRTPFKLLEFYLANGGAPVIAPKAPFVLPPNAPPQLINQLWNQVAQQAVTDMSQPAVEVSYNLVNALIESPRVATEYFTTGSLTASRLAGGEIQLSATDKKSGWRNVQIPPAA